MLLKENRLFNKNGGWFYKNRYTFNKYPRIFYKNQRIFYKNTPVFYKQPGNGANSATKRIIFQILFDFYHQEIYNFDKNTFETMMGTSKMKLSYQERKPMV